MAGHPWHSIIRYSGVRVPVREKCGTDVVSDRAGELSNPGRLAIDLEIHAHWDHRFDCIEECDKVVFVRFENEKGECSYFRSGVRRSLQ